LQYSLDDSMLDLLFDSFAGFIVAAAGAHYLKSTSPEHFVRIMNVEAAKDRLETVRKKAMDR
jgi:hypothetical protein